MKSDISKLNDEIVRINERLTKGEACKEGAKLVGQKQKKLNITIAIISTLSSSLCTYFQRIAKFPIGGPDDGLLIYSSKYNLHVSNFHWQ